MNENKIVNHDSLRHDETGLMYLNDELFTGISQWFWENGQLGSEISYKKGVQDGLARSWHENGQISEETHYRNESVEGIDKEWYESGQLKMEQEIKNGKVAWKKEWDETGNLINEVIS